MVKEFTRQINANRSESYVSLILGFLVVVVSGVLLYNFMTKRTTAPPADTLPTPTISQEIIATVSGTLTLTRPQATVTISPTTAPTSTPSPAQPTQVSPAPTAAGSGSIHTVQKGETLWTLSERFYGSGFEWRKIAEANYLANPRIIEVGQQLTIPGGEQKGAVTSSTATEFPKSYTVVPGDSLWKISIAHYGTGFEWPYIAQENKLAMPNVILPGTVLQLPRPHATLDPPGGTSPSSGK